MAASIHVTNGLNLSGEQFECRPECTLYCDGAGQTVDNLTLHESSGSVYVGGPASVGAVTATLGSHATVVGSLSFRDYSINETLLNFGAIASNSTGTSTLSILTTSFTNHGSIQSAGSSGAVNVSSTSWTNATDGTISAAAGALTLSGTWSNSGVISVSDGATLNIGGTASAASVTSINATAGATVNLTGTLNNATGTNAPTLTFSSVQHPWNLKGGTINSGNVDFGNRLNIISGTLNSVTVVQGGLVNVPAGSTLTMSGNWANLGTINVGDSATLNLSGTTSSASVAGISPSSTSTVNLTGTINNATGTNAPTLTFSNAVQPWNLNGGTINSGKVDFGNRLNIVSGTLNSVTVAPGG